MYSSLTHGELSEMEEKLKIYQRALGHFNYLVSPLKITLDIGVTVNLAVVKCLQTHF